MAENTHESILYVTANGHCTTTVIGLTIRQAVRQTHAIAVTLK